MLQPEGHIRLLPGSQAVKPVCLRRWMVFHEERIDTAFSSGKTAAAGHGGVDLILGNEMLDGWHLGKVRRKSPAVTV